MKCTGCEKEAPPHHNWCSWECHVETCRREGGIEIRPNGLPVRCLTATGLMLECEHGDHPNYMFPVEVGRENFVDRHDEEPLNSSHALIFTDGSIALTLYECCYTMWSLRDGRSIGGPRWTVGQRLSTESLEKVRAATPKRSDAT